MCSNYCREERFVLEKSVCPKEDGEKLQSSVLVPWSQGLKRSQIQDEVLSHGKSWVLLFCLCCLDAWVELESLQLLSANYCALLPPPRSTIAARFTTMGRRWLHTWGPCGKDY
ncbi:hypothetical protein Patl1_13782 [Pistacia atlantica]|uniref:Uncharacterized protein n=1 Tax=Pistacia atlantica TaxID=434234 RepID=A0ACC1AWW2_9ROSI|nr:hypothetical protein Patl1_13782 [Pistacia atlantica]